MTTSETPVEPLPAPPLQAVVGVRFREAARIYRYRAESGLLFPNDYVVVETARGEELAWVVTVPDAEEPARRVPPDVRPIVRLATREDRDQAADGQRRADQILKQMRRIVAREGLELYPVAVQLNLPGSEATGFFESEDRVDFRSVVREIEEEHDVLLKMQHVGARDRAKLIDGYDVCGQRLCCSSWMTSFPKVGIRTAKDQELALNHHSLSGVCGRMLCCLTFEHPVYLEMRGTLPKVGKRVSTPAGMGKVVKRNVLQQYVTIALDDHAQRVDVPVAEIGLAVRTEDGPDQALIDREREQESREPQRRAPASPASKSQLVGASEDSDNAPAERRQRRRRTAGGDQPPRPRIKPAPRRAGDQRRGERRNKGRSAGSDESTAAAPEPQRRRRRRRAGGAGGHSPGASGQE